MAETAKKIQVLERDLVADAEDANNRDHELTILEAIKLYPKAVGWSMALSAACIMDGYDYHVIGLLFAQPAFRQAYGKLRPDGDYQISAAWQAGLNNGSAIGTLTGLFLAGYLTERFGFRKTLMFTLALITCLIFIQFFATSLVVLQIGQILTGVPLAIFQTVTCVYAAEVAPTCLRAFLTSYVSQMWVIGQILVSCVTRGVLHFKAPWPYRIPFAIQWVWPLPILVAVILAPESPWWLVRQHRIEEAKASLKRLTSGADNNTHLDKAISLMVLTTEHEREMNASTSYAACFRGTDLHRTLLVIFCFCMQIVGGTTLRSYAVYFFEQAGLPTEQAFNMAIVTYVLSFVGTVVAWFLMPHFGRRAIFLFGVCTLTAIYFTIGGLGISHGRPPLTWTVASLLVINGFICYVCMIPIIFVLVAEVPSTLLRSKTIPIGRIVYNVVNVAASILTSYQINSSAWDWGAKSGFFWAVSATMGVILTYYVLPETKDRTAVELDLLFEKKTGARDFAKTTVDIPCSTLHDPA